MNVALKLNNINSYNICFLEPKKNIIMDGSFTKINFLNEYFTMNGIYIIFLVNNYSFSNNENKNYLKFNYTQNKIFIEYSQLENNLLDYYKNVKNVNKKKSCLLTKQLNNGSIKLYKENTKFNDIHFILKISGVWENTNEIGLTYKLFLTQSYF
jgi:hypothetical protein|tara:strand:+ start:5481 stop:5942 length:462 start_codon:yes stop_codon:yes gene_type:complete